MTDAQFFSIVTMIFGTFIGTVVVMVACTHDILKEIRKQKNARPTSM